MMKAWRKVKVVQKYRLYDQKYRNKEVSINITPTNRSYAEVVIGNWNNYPLQLDDAQVKAQDNKLPGQASIDLSSVPITYLIDYK